MAPRSTIPTSARSSISHRDVLKSHCTGLRARASARAARIDPRARYLAPNCSKSGKKPEMRRDCGHFCRKSLFHLIYQAGPIPRILPPASVPVRAGPAVRFVFLIPRRRREWLKVRLKWFNPTKGYGFIQPSAGGKDVFVHISAVEKAGLSTLTKGRPWNTKRLPIAARPRPRTSRSSACKRDRRRTLD